MEKVKLQKYGIIYYGDYDAQSRRTDDFCLSLIITDQEKTTYAITNGRFAGYFLAEQDGGVKLFKHPVMGVWLGTRYRPLDIGCFESIADAKGTTLKQFNVEVGSVLVNSFFETFIFVKQNDPKMLSDLTMEEFAKVYDILPQNIFTIKSDTMSLKERAYQSLEHQIDRTFRQLSASEREGLKTEYREQLKQLIEANKAQDDEPNAD